MCDRSRRVRIHPDPYGYGERREDQRRERGGAVVYLVRVGVRVSVRVRVRARGRVRARV